MSQSGAWGGDPIGSLSEDTLEDVALIEEALREKIAVGSSEYLWAKDIAADLPGISSTKVGVLLQELKLRENGVTISKWSRTSPYRYCITNTGASE
jgi:hypothetical protein